MDLLHERLAKYDLPQQMKEKGIYPYFREIEGKQGTEVEMEGHNVLMFGSNAYTGLTGDDRVINAGIEAMKKYGSGCAGSRFLNGTLDSQVACETNLKAIERLVPHAIVKRYDRLNHLFQTCDGWTTSLHYATIQETLAPQVLTDITEWIQHILR